MDGTGGTVTAIAILVVMDSVLVKNPSNVSAPCLDRLENAEQSRGQSGLWKTASMLRPTCFLFVHHTKPVMFSTVLGVLCSQEPHVFTDAAFIKILHSWGTHIGLVYGNDFHETGR